MNACMSASPESGPVMAAPTFCLLELLDLGLAHRFDDLAHAGALGVGQPVDRLDRVDHERAGAGLAGAGAEHGHRRHGEGEDGAASQVRQANGGPGQTRRATGPTIGCHDGAMVLHRQTADLLALMEELDLPRVEDQTPDEAREQRRAMLRPSPEPIAEVRDVDAGGVDSPPLPAGHDALGGTAGVVPRRRVGVRRPRHPRRHVPRPRQPGWVPGAVGRLPLGAGAPVPGRPRRRQRRHGVGARARRRARCGAAARRRRRLGRRQPRRRRRQPARRAGVLPGPRVPVHRRPHGAALLRRERRGLRPDVDGHGLVLRPLPRRRRRVRPTIRACRRSSRTRRGWRRRPRRS